MIHQRENLWFLGWSLVGFMGILCLPMTTRAVEPAHRLSDEAIAAELFTVPGWTADEQTLSCTYEFENFVEAIAFVNRLVEPAETIGHHPDLLIRYNRVTVSLTTHDVGGLTFLDFELARQLESCPSPGV